MAISPTDRNESLQCVACAVRQQRGQAITERDLANAILDWDNDSLEYSIVNSKSSLATLMWAPIDSR